MGTFSFAAQAREYCLSLRSLAQVSLAQMGTAQVAIAQVYSRWCPGASVALPSGYHPHAHLGGLLFDRALCRGRPQDVFSWAHLHEHVNRSENVFSSKLSSFSPSVFTIVDNAHVSFVAENQMLANPMVEGPPSVGVRTNADCKHT